MKLSEAIKKGSLKHPQTTGRLIREGLSKGEERTCALGAAYVGYFGELPYGSEVEPCQRLREAFPELQKFKVLDDQGKFMEGCSLESQIVHLNDTIKITREEIARLLEERGF